MQHVADAITESDIHVGRVLRDKRADTDAVFPVMEQVLDQQTGWDYRRRRGYSG